MFSPSGIVQGTVHRGWRFECGGFGGFNKQLGVCCLVCCCPIPFEGGSCAVILTVYGGVQNRPDNECLQLWNTSFFQLWL